MLRLEERITGNPELKTHFVDIHNRVKSMSLIHQQLYQPESDLQEIEIGDYVRELVKEIGRTYNNKLQTEVNISSISLDIDSALTCGLILNELVNNAYKYAYPKG